MSSIPFTGSNGLNILQTIIIYTSILLFSVMIVGPQYKLYTFGGFLILGVVITILMIIFTNTTNYSFENSLPKSSYPLPPHTGLNGVSLEILGSNNVY